MRKAKELLNKRDQVLWSLRAQDSVYDALQVLATHNIGAIVVMDGDKMVGILSERDYTRKIALTGRNSRETAVSEIMTYAVLSVTPDTDVKDCMALMSQKRIRHLPVVQDGKVLGMLSIRDIMDDIIADHELTISQLQSFINS